MKKKQEISRQEISTTRSKTVTKPEMSVFDKNRREGRVKVVATKKEEEKENKRYKNNKDIL